MDDDESPRVILKTEDPVYLGGIFLYQHPAYKWIINSEVQLQLDYVVDTGQVKIRALCLDGTTIGTYNGNPILNSIVYEAELLDGQSKVYSSNGIANNTLSQVN